jgi:hypothetical protein
VPLIPSSKLKVFKDHTGVLGVSRIYIACCDINVIRNRLELKYNKTLSSCSQPKLTTLPSKTIGRRTEGHGAFINSSAKKLMEPACIKESDGKNRKSPTSSAWEVELIIGMQQSAEAAEGFLSSPSTSLGVTSWREMIFRSSSTSKAATIVESGDES